MKTTKHVALLYVIIAAFFATKFGPVSTQTHIFNNTLGKFSSPSYPQHYGKNEKVSYSIFGQPGMIIKLSWQVFEIVDYAPECTDAYFRIILGCDAPRRILTRFCATNGSMVIPPDVYSNDHCMYLEFQTNSNIQQGGRFMAKYEQLDKTKPLATGSCLQTKSDVIDVNTTTKTIHSPNWPSPYFGHVPFNGHNTCTWRIRVGKEVSAVKFLFTKIDTQTPFTASSRLCYHRQNDYVRLKVKSQNGKTYYYRYCGTQKNAFARLFVGYEEFEITMYTPVTNTHSKTGFMISYFPMKGQKSTPAPKDNDEKGGFDKGWIFAIVIVALFVLVAIYKNRFRIKKKWRKMRLGMSSAFTKREKEPEVVRPAFQIPPLQGSTNQPSTDVYQPQHSFLPASFNPDVPSSQYATAYQPPPPPPSQNTPLISGALSPSAPPSYSY